MELIVFIIYYPFRIVKLYKNFVHKISEVLIFFDVWLLIYQSRFDIMNFTFVRSKDSDLED